MQNPENQLDAFLAEMESALSDMPASSRHEILDETRVHLEAMLAARSSDGFSGNAAWESVRLSFGEPRTIGKALAKAWHKGPTSYAAQIAESDRRTRAANFTLILWLGAFYIITRNVIPGLLPLSAASLTTLALIPLLIGFQTWGFRRRRATLTPSKIKALALPSGVLLSLEITLNLDAHLQGTLATQITDALFGLTVLMVCYLMLLWEKREVEKNAPDPIESSSSPHPLD